jgi:hypothetical protein
MHAPVVPIDLLLRRVASELGAAAEGLAQLEVQVVLLTEASTDCDSMALQSLDRLTQHVRAIADFLHDASMGALGAVAIGEALSCVPLAELKDQLAGASASLAPAETEFW